MTKIPLIFRRTKTVRNLKAYMNFTFSEVLHTTLNPEGPGFGSSAGTPARKKIVRTKIEYYENCPSCACASSCACACACASSGRAGCSVKEFFLDRIHQGRVRIESREDQQKEKPHPEARDF